MALLYKDFLLRFLKYSTRMAIVNVWCDFDLAVTPPYLDTSVAYSNDCSRFQKIHG
jgi:hypothetical protein